MKKYFFGPNSENTFAKSLTLLATLFIGVAAGFILKSILLYYEKPESQHYEIRESGFKFISPLLECESTRSALENKELRPFKYKVEHFIEENLDKKIYRDIAVYFRDLNNGPWFSIGPTESFKPASLLKVPLMIAVLKEAELSPNFLKKKIKFKDTFDYSAFQRIKPSKKLEKDKDYTIDELLYRLVVYSDNNADILLEGAINPSILKEAYSDLGIENPYKSGKENVMSVETYASFFRILYNSSYLNKNMSEKALEYLSKSEYNTGLVAGVPEGIVVSHKFGEYVLPDSKGSKQLHDCGIVYYPNRPYLLCIMTRGDYFEHLDEGIREISLMVYDEIEQQRIK